MYEENRQINYYFSQYIGIPRFIVFFHEAIFASINTCCIDFYVYNQQKSSYRQSLLRYHVVIYRFYYVFCAAQLAREIRRGFNFNSWKFIGYLRLSLSPTAISTSMVGN
jgi:hypothetical protein